MYKAVDLTTLPYGAETWTIYSNRASKLKHFHFSYLHRILIENQPGNLRGSCSRLIGLEKVNEDRRSNLRSQLDRRCQSPMCLGSTSPITKPFQLAHAANTPFRVFSGKMQPHSDSMFMNIPTITPASNPRKSTATTNLAAGDHTADAPSPSITGTILLPQPRRWSW
ncbi:unnamed protein product [Schistocephalus solidus]|uniref:Uncharacterized protein n=1 Tax=Schistocephalus solidus TaxID=70667 RepID=A0A183TTI0_SCHSO|nr:unnamed protein product [Schistocephalus solidus]